MPRKILIQKWEKCKGGEQSKERLSLLFCCDANGENTVTSFFSHNSRWHFSKGDLISP
jgi:hypothetical protein